jgi:hypothetical protein
MAQRTSHSDGGQLCQSAQRKSISTLADLQWDVARRRQRKKQEEQKGTKILQSAKKDRVEDAEEDEDDD